MLSTTLPKFTDVSADWPRRRSSIVLHPSITSVSVTANQKTSFHMISILTIHKSDFQISEQKSPPAFNWPSLSTVAAAFPGSCLTPRAEITLIQLAGSETGSGLWNQTNELSTRPGPHPVHRLRAHRVLRVNGGNLRLIRSDLILISDIGPIFEYWIILTIWYLGAWRRFGAD